MHAHVVVVLTLMIFDLCRCLQDVLIFPDPMVIGQPLVINFSPIQIQNMVQEQSQGDNGEVEKLTIKKLTNPDNKVAYMITHNYNNKGDEGLVTRKGKDFEIQFEKGGEAAIIMRINKATCNDIGIVRFEAELAENKTVTKDVWVDIFKIHPVLSVDPVIGPYKQFSYLTLKCEVSASIRALWLEFLFRPPGNDYFLKVPLPKNTFESHGEKWPPTPVLENYSQNCSICPNISTYQYQIILTFQVEILDILKMEISCVARLPTGKPNTPHDINQHLDFKANGSFRLDQCSLTGCAFVVNSSRVIDLGSSGIKPENIRQSPETDETDAEDKETFVYNLVGVAMVVIMLCIAIYALLSLRSAEEDSINCTPPPNSADTDVDDIAGDSRDAVLLKESVAAITNAQESRRSSTSEKTLTETRV